MSSQTSSCITLHINVDNIQSSPPWKKSAKCPIIGHYSVITLLHTRMIFANVCYLNKRMIKENYLVINDNDDDDDDDDDDLGSFLPC